MSLKTPGKDPVKLKSITFSIIPWHLSSHYVIGKSARMHTFFYKAERSLQKNGDYFKVSTSSKDYGIKKQNKVLYIIKNLVQKYLVTSLLLHLVIYMKTNTFNITFCIIWCAYILIRKSISKNGYKIFYDL